jgi:hypothetical protein
VSDRKACPSGTAKYCEGLYKATLRVRAGRHETQPGTRDMAPSDTEEQPRQPSTTAPIGGRQPRRTPCEYPREHESGCQPGPHQMTCLSPGASLVAMSARSTRGQLAAGPTGERKRLRP